MSDTISGGGGNDVLQGGGGSDLINGGAGLDFVMGNKGDDTLTGGANADGFYFQNGDGHDTITDFNLAEDKLGFISPTFDAVSDLTIVDSGSDAVITYGAASITVLGISAAELSDPGLYLWY